MAYSDRSGGCVQRIACGSDGKIYSTPCALEAAKGNNPGLKEVECGSVSS